uniref:Putative ubiquitin carrier protein n=1 Tax=Tanacetum cinerariifolium TaxID=118510 RepID=A0A6L2KD45_TANCI|nr:putative ubiquitin carrier protein [Tanacetum cinerariifolium]
MGLSPRDLWTRMQLQKLAYALVFLLLIRKYKTEDAGTKKFVVARFLDYKMVDSKNVISQANMVNDDVDMIVMVSDMCAMISEVNLVGTNHGGWWIDTGATRHVCAVKRRRAKEMLLKSKDEAIDKFVLYKTEVENQLGKKIKVVRSDRGGEYVSPFIELCAKHGIRHEFTAPYSPMQNGIAERKNHTLKEMVAMPIPKAQNIGPKSVDCIFIGYAKNNRAYRFIVHESKNMDIQKNTVMESRNASFFEHIFPCLSKETRSSSRLDDEVVKDKIHRDDNDLQDERQDQIEEEEVELRRSKRARNEKSFGPDFVSFMVENEPTSYQEAEIVDLPLGCKPLGYKWIFKKKMKADGTIDKYKASNDKMIKSAKDMLKSKFDMKDMGLADVILGIKIIRTHNGLLLRQAHYVDKIHSTHNVGDSDLARTPIDTSLHLSKNRGVGVAQLEYSRIIGMLMYLMSSSRPDLAYAVSRLSRYTSNLSNVHWKAMTRVLHYLRYSRDSELHYDRHHVVIKGYNDANWISDIKDSRSTSGYVFTLGGAAISWKSSK